MGKKSIKAIDTLRIHFTTLGKVYDVTDEDDECYKIFDDREKPNWVPKRYFKVEDSE
jgi:hypothetical protein